MKKLFWLQILLFFEKISGYLDFEELGTVEYGLNLLDTPVIKGQAETASEMYMTSIHGQQYQCSFKEVGEERKKEKEDEQVAIETGIKELLRPMKEGPCLVYNKGWWTYEFCYGKELKQYHMEDQKIDGALIYLGFYESEFDWNNATDKKKNSLNRYHSQHYVNGTVCDLTNKLRKAEVRFMCEEGAGDHIARIDEPETCAYIVTVQTTKICHHPYLKPVKKVKPVPIKCMPVLSASQYEQYMAHKEALRLQKEEAVLKYKNKMLKDADELKRARELLAEKEAEAAQDLEEGSDGDGSDKTEDLSSRTGIETHEGINEAMLKHEKMLKEIDELARARGLIDEKEAAQDGEEGSDGEGSDKTEDLSSGKGLDTHEGVNDAMQEIHKIFSDSLTRGLQEILKDNDMGDDFDVDNIEMDMKIVNDPAELRKVMNDMLRKKSNKITPSSTDIEDEHDVEGDNDEALSTSDVDTNSDGEMREYIVENRDEQKTSLYKKVTKGDQDVDSEATVEVEDEEGVVDDEEDEDKEILDDFDKEIDEITGKSKTQNGRLARHKDTISSAMQAKFSDIVDEAQQELDNEGIDTDVNKKEMFGKLTETLTKLLKRLDDNVVQDENEVVDEFSQKDSPGDTNPTKDPSDQSSSGGSTTVQKDNTDKSLDNSRTQSLKKRQQRLEGTVKETLEKAGMTTQGRKVEVRIVTSGYYNDKDGTVHMLDDDDDSVNVKKMVFAILGDNDDELREAQRLQQQEEAYNFQWHGSPDTAESSREDHSYSSEEQEGEQPED